MHRPLELSSMETLDRFRFIDYPVPVSPAVHLFPRTGEYSWAILAICIRYSSQVALVGIYGARTIEDRERLWEMHRRSKRFSEV